jgi:hypothetical protein
MSTSKVLLIAGIAALGGAAFFVWKKGGISGAAQAIGAGAVNAADGIATGGMTAISEKTGLPTPAQTTTDPAISRWIIDNVGHFEASKWSSAAAYAQALFLPAGSGTKPAPGSDLARQFAAQVNAYSATDTGDETARLLKRYPAPSAPDSILSGTTFLDVAGYPPTGFDAWGVGP